jgi:hypothetical protein
MIAALALDVAAALAVDNNKETILSQTAVIVKGIFSDLTVNKEKADLFQKFVGCCGIENSADWTRASLPIPPSCCKNEKESCNVPLDYKEVNILKYYCKKNCVINRHFLIFLGLP